MTEPRRSTPAPRDLRHRASPRRSLRRLPGFAASVPSRKSAVAAASLGYRRAGGGGTRLHGLRRRQLCPNKRTCPEAAGRSHKGQGTNPLPRESVARLLGGVPLRALTVFERR